MPEEQRKPIVGGNWKMNTSRLTARALAQGIAEDCGALLSRVEVVLFPPFPYLLTVLDCLGGGGGQDAIQLGAQDVFSASDGAFTGEISCAMLRDCGCTWVLAGHSERRHVIGESDEIVNAKVLTALKADLHVILCIGETRLQREQGATDHVNRTQLIASLQGVGTEQMRQVVIAYEPVWAIGTGLNATPEDAQTAHVEIRRAIAEKYDAATAGQTRIQYGGSMKPANAATLLKQPDVDGGLIGGASLIRHDFAAIVKAAASI